MTDKVQEIMALVDEAIERAFRRDLASAEIVKKELESRLREVVAPPVPEPEIAHPNNRYLLKYLCDLAGIELGKDSVSTAIEKASKLTLAPTEATHTQPASEPDRWVARAGELVAAFDDTQPASEPVAWTVAGPVTNWSKDFSAYRTQHYVRPVFATPQPAAKQAEPVARDGWRSLEPYLGKDVANKEVVLLDDVKALLAASPTQPRPQPLSDDPLQGAVDWFLQADGEFFCVATVQRTLRIGYNRAKRLCDVAKERAIKPAQEPTE